VLNEETLTNLSAATINLRVVSERAIGTLDRVDLLVETNAPSLGVAVSNVVFFSEQINLLAASLGGVLETNSAELASAMKNVEAASITVKQLLDDVDAGRGLAGTLLRNETMASDFRRIAHNLSVTTSNLNQRGLWGILWSRRAARNEPAASETGPLESPRSDSR
jgi:hypothetical protein